MDEPYRVKAAATPFAGAARHAHVLLTTNHRPERTKFKKFLLAASHRNLYAFSRETSEYREDHYNENGKDNNLF